MCTLLQEVVQEQGQEQEQEVMQEQEQEQEVMQEQEPYPKTIPSLVFLSLGRLLGCPWSAAGLNRVKSDFTAALRDTLKCQNVSRS